MNVEYFRYHKCRDNTVIATAIIDGKFYDIKFNEKDIEAGEAYQAIIDMYENDKKNNG